MAEEKARRTEKSLLSRQKSPLYVQKTIRQYFEDGAKAAGDDYMEKGGLKAIKGMSRKEAQKYIDDNMPNLSPNLYFRLIKDKKITDTFGGMQIGSIPTSRPTKAQMRKALMGQRGRNKGR